MLITTEGAVISVRDLKDNDCFITVLSPKMGLIDITVKGVKKLGSGNTAAVQLFAAAKFCFNERGGRYYLNSSSPVKIFYGLRLDMQRLALASYFAEIIRWTVTSSQSANDIYRLFLNSLYMLSEKRADCGFVKFVFEMRITSELGHMPYLMGCRECFCFDKPLYFLINKGIFLCSEHFDPNSLPEVSAPLLTRGMFEALRFVCLSEPEKIFSFKLTEDALQRLGEISEMYLREQLERRFKTLDFYKQMTGDPSAASE
ncbi:MAG: DNA repair protein RecO [Ruminococcus sp.]|nr:DNA repair protein RecO [Ruminococcus sp.]